MSAAPLQHRRFHLPLVLRIALRDLRGGFGGFNIFLACIALGVAAIVGVGSVSHGLSDGLAREGRRILGGDLAGVPNGRRTLDNVTKIELQAVAGATIPLVDPSYTPDAVVASVSDGTTNTNPPLLPAFPWMGLPSAGYQSMPGQPSTAGNGSQFG